MTDPSDSNGSDPLDAVVADYLQKVEAGTPPDRDALVAAHPDLADRLRAFFANLDRLGDRGEAFRLPDVTPPDDFGDYEIEGEIGRGGMGVVYRARQKSLGGIVALKMILGGPLPDGDAARRFREEAATVARLDHPHIVPVYDTGEHGGRPYFTMELINGRSLTRCLDRYANDPRGAAELLAKVCDAVHHAHQRGVLHRDLKPGNILVDTAGEPHVTDFGLARRVEEALTLTSTGAVVGTPEYMAPEQASGAKDLTTAVDVYGLGAVLYALLTGRPPFQADTVYAALRRVIEELPTPPRKVRRAVPRDLDTICLKCLEKSSARRYASAAELAADLRRWLHGRPIVARPVGPLERLGKWAWRRPAAAALALVSAVAVATLAVGGATFARRLADRNQELGHALNDLETANDDLKQKGEELKAAGARTLEALKAQKEANARAREALWLARRDRFTLQLTRVAAAYERDPKRALDLLHDYEECPIDLRDTAWRYYENAARSNQLGTSEGSVVAHSSTALLGWGRREAPISPAHRGRRWALVRVAPPERGPPVDVLRDRDTRELPLRVMCLLTGEVRATLPSDLWAAPIHTWNAVISLDGGTGAWLEDDGKGKRQVVVCDIATGKLNRPPVPIPERAKLDLLIAPDGRRLVCHAEFARPLLYDLATGQELHRFESEAFNLVFSPDGKRLAYRLGARIRVLDLETRNVTGEIESLPSDAPEPLASISHGFTPDGRFLVLRREVAPPPRAPGAKPPAKEPRATGRLTVHPVDDPGRVRFTTDYPIKSFVWEFSLDGKLIALSANESFAPPGEQPPVVVIDTDAWEVRHRLPGQRATRAVFSSDGQQLVGARADSDGVFMVSSRTLVSWDLRTGRVREDRHDFSADHSLNSEWVTVIGVTPRNELRALVGGLLRQWNLNPETVGRAIPVKGCYVTRMQFADDAKTLLMLDPAYRKIGEKEKYREPITSTEFPAIHGDEVPPIRVNGHEVEGATETYCVDLDTDAVVTVVGADKRLRERPAVKHTDPDGDGWAFFWGEESGELVNAGRVRALPIARQGRTYLAAAPDGNSLLFGTADGRLELWDVWTGRHRATLTGHAQPVRLACFSPDGGRLAALAKDGTVRVWDLRRHPAVWRAGRDARFTQGATGDGVLTPTGDAVTQLVWGQLRLINLATGQPVPTCPRVRTSVQPGIAFTPDGKYMVTFAKMDRGENRGVRIFEVATGAQVAQIEVEGTGDDRVLSWCLSPDGSTVAFFRPVYRSAPADNEYQLDLIAVPSGAKRTLPTQPLPRGEFAIAQLPCPRVAFTTDGKSVLVELAKEKAHPGGFLVDGQQAYAEKRLVLDWIDAASGERLRRVESPALLEPIYDRGGGPRLPPVHPGGLMLLNNSRYPKDPDSEYRGREYRLWGPTTGKDLWRQPVASLPAAEAFSADGRYLATGAESGTITVRETATGRVRARFEAREVLFTSETHVAAIAFSGDVKRLVSLHGHSGRGAATVVWDLPTQP